MVGMGRPTDRTRQRARAAVHGALRMAVLAGFAATAAPLSAQTYSFDSVQISGNQRIETGTILTYAGIARGDTVSAGELNAAAQRIRASGLFEVVDVVPQGRTLIITVTEYPTINRISFEGNSRVNDEQLAAVVRSAERRVFSPVQAEADVEAIVEAYVTEGRINAQVTPRIIRRDDNRVDLVFEITEGAVTEIDRISFVGNRSFSDRRLRGVLETKQVGALSFVIQSDTFVAERIALDRRQLEDFYRSRGYADFTIQSVDVALTRERDGYLVTFNVVEGQRYLIGDVTLTSAIPEVDVGRYANQIRLSRGEIYSPVAIDNEITRLENLGFDEGISFLRVEPRIVRDERNGLLNVEFAILRGPRVFVERIDIEGNTTTLDRVIRNQFDQVEGDPFNPRAIRASAERIRGLGFFSDAAVDSRPGSREDQVVIDVNVVEQPTGSLSFGANYSTDNGFGLIASFAERNFLGRGQTLRFNFGTAIENRQFRFEFEEPQFTGRDVSFGFSANYRTTDNDNALYDTINFSLIPSLGFPLGERSRIQVFAQAEFTDLSDVTGERSDPPEDRASLIIFDEADEGRVWNYGVGYNYSFDTRRSEIARNGGFVLRFGQDYATGDTTFVRTSALAAYERRVFGEDLVLRATLEGGHLEYIEGNSRVTDRFFMGGRVMRGFDPKGIGPRDAQTGDALGGDSFAVIRLESEFPLGLPEEYGITGGAFVDYGSVWDVGNLGSLDAGDVLYNDFTPRAVIGVSIFWTTPFGPLRFNWTEALLAEEEDEPRSFDLTVSTTF
jgi:outer membrane protein insertion porin family